MTKSASIEGTILVIIVGGAIGGLIYSVFTKNEAPQQAQAPYHPEIALDANAEPNVDADANTNGGSRKRKRRGKKIRKSKRRGKKY